MADFFIEEAKKFSSILFQRQGWKRRRGPKKNKDKSSTFKGPHKFVWVRKDSLNGVNQKPLDSLRNGFLGKSIRVSSSK